MTPEDNSHKDTGLETLLNLDGDIQYQEDGEHFAKIEARRVEKTDDRPHGIKYSRTLHDGDGTRVLGFDNAHAVPPTGSHFKHVGKKYPFDHQHRHATDKGVLYQFDTAYQLLSDFYEEVDKYLKEFQNE